MDRFIGFVLVVLCLVGAWLVLRAIWAAFFGVDDPKFTAKHAPDLFTKDGRLRDWRDPAP